VICFKSPSSNAGNRPNVCIIFWLIHLNMLLFIWIDQNTWFIYLIHLIPVAIIFSCNLRLNKAYMCLLLCYCITLLLSLWCIYVFLFTLHPHTHKSYICICLSFILSSCFHRQTQTMKMKFLHMILMMFILILHKPIWILASIVDPLVPSPQISPFSPILTSITVSASSPGTTFSLNYFYFFWQSIISNLNF
jgi:hypothetical protein